MFSSIRHVYKQNSKLSVRNALTTQKSAPCSSAGLWKASDLHERGEFSATVATVLPLRGKPAVSLCSSRQPLRGRFYGRFDTLINHSVLPRQPDLLRFKNILKLPNRALTHSRSRPQLKSHREPFWDNLVFYQLSFLCSQQVTQNIAEEFPRFMTFLQLITFSPKLR